MRINVLRMGGAGPGILGSSGADGEVVHNLKKSAIAFASEYRKPQTNQAELERLTNEVAGSFQTLNLMNTLSDEETNKLLDQLQGLTDKASV